jgi:hypothetical protein
MNKEFTALHAIADAFRQRHGLNSSPQIKDKSSPIPTKMSLLFSEVSFKINELSRYEE